ncbi:MAG: hypothetical protein A3I69_02755 [Deltaproteobacteria bacterium RIFCSPLOWO2_02_FULL_40_36]|nr:MAG: hypothetical protein A3I69_02755 [Deltaproteobacteria bacterium RIFCSPLOWO2_02_FULL_40_36]
MMFLKKQKWASIFIINVFILWLLLEVLLRIVWKSPYTEPFPNTALYYPNLSTIFRNVDQVFDGGLKEVKFKTSHLSFILNEKNELPHGNYALSLGGSTTECALLPEGKRWPDLINTPTLNYGKSRLDSIDSYFNLKYILDHFKLHPQFIFVLDGVNNLSHLLSDRFIFEETSYQHQYGVWWQNAILRHFYVFTFVKKFFQNQNYVEFYKSQVENNLKHPPMFMDDLQKTWMEKRDLFHKKLLEINSKIKNLALSHHSQVILLTQPHSFFEDYVPSNKLDLRVTPIVDGKRLGILEAGWLMNEFNKLTIQVAKELNIIFLDTAECMAKQNSSNLFYDAVHLTETGAKVFAQCINEELR